MDTDGQSGQPTHEEGALLTLPEAAKRLNRAPKTVRRYIKDGRLPAEAVQTVQGDYGREYRLDPVAVDALAEALSRGTGMVPTQRPAASGLMVVQAVQRLQLDHTQFAESVQAVQGALGRLVQGQEDQAKALGALRELIEAQAGQLHELRAELQEERQRRIWWRRLFGSRGGDRVGR